MVGICVVDTHVLIIWVGGYFMKSDLRIVKVDNEDVLVFHEGKEIAIVSIESLKELIKENIVEINSYRRF